MPSISLKSVRERLYVSMIEAECCVQCANKAVELVATFGEKMTYSALAGKSRVRVATRAAFEEIPINGFREWKGYEIREQSLRNAVTRMNNELWPRHYVMRAQRNGNYRVFRLPDHEVPEAMKHLDDATIAPPKLPKGHMTLADYEEIERRAEEFESRPEFQEAMKGAEKAAREKAKKLGY